MKKLRGPSPARASSRGKHFPAYLQLLTAIEDCYSIALASSGEFLDAAQKSELWDKLLDCRALVLGEMPWSDPPVENSEV